MSDERPVIFYRYAERRWYICSPEGPREISLTEAVRLLAEEKAVLDSRDRWLRDRDPV